MFRTRRKRGRHSTTWRRISDVGTRLAIATITLILVLAGLTAAQGPAEGWYASMNGLKMYYEVRGSGKPVVLLHGAFGIEPQDHGHAGDVDGPLSFEQMADDVAALLKELKLDKADIFGYGMGGTVALYTAIKHAELVNELAILGSSSGQDAWDRGARTNRGRNENCAKKGFSRVLYWFASENVDWATGRVSNRYKAKHKRTI
jgi:pimeloyl-ACP methyl ester carboxylesterase